MNSNHYSTKQSSAVFIMENNCIFSEVKLKDSRNRPGVTQRVPRGLGSQIS
jgi:hypothetical protein